MNQNMSMTERSVWKWCLGKLVPVEITMNDGSKREGSVAALNPNEKKGPWRQTKGLFLDGARFEDDPTAQAIFKRAGMKVVVKVETKDGKDITKHIKSSFGPSM